MKINIRNESHTSPFTSKGFIVALIIVGILAVGAIVMVVLGIFDNKQEQKPAATPVAEVTDTRSDSVCGLPGSEETELATAPASTWSFVGIISAPMSPTIGPKKTSAEGLRTCFSQSPEGALFFAANYFAMSTDARLVKFLPELMIAGPGRDIMMAAATEDSVSGVSQSQMVFVGFKLLSYSRSEATVELLINSGGRLLAFPVVASWEDGDWKLVVTESGGLPLDATLVDSSIGYVAWGEQ